ncbi:MAG: hypothetical protein IJB29_01170 [Mailhella sp.]|nr:hypothetical protein [Mailhella sp.]
MKRFTALLAFLFCLAMAVPALAEPFGVRMGDSPDRFPEAAGKSGKNFYLSTVPAPQPGFAQYIVTFEQDGLCAISGLKEFPAGEGGVLAFFNQQNEKLIQEYGPPLRYLDAGWLTWLDSAHPDDKAMKAQLHALRDYGFGVLWLLKDRDDGLDAVQVTIASKSETACTYIVTYFFKNYKE